MSRVSCPFKPNGQESHSGKGVFAQIHEDTEGVAAWASGRK